MINVFIHKIKSNGSFHYINDYIIQNYKLIVDLHFWHIRIKFSFIDTYSHINVTEIKLTFLGRAM